MDRLHLHLLVVTFWFGDAQWEFFNITYYITCAFSVATEKKKKKLPQLIVIGLKKGDTSAESHGWRAALCNHNTGL